MENRKKRREHFQKNRFYGESKNYHLTVVGNKKYRRRKQYILLEDGSIKTILHYDEMNQAKKPKSSKREK